MPAWETLEKTYSNAITAAFPLHRLIIFLCGAVFSLAIKTQDYSSIVQTIANTKLSEFTSLSSDLFKHTELSDVICGFSLIAFSWFISRFFTKLIFFFGVEANNVWSKIESNSNDFDFNKLEISKRKEIVEWIDFITSTPRAKISTINSFSELFMGFSLVLFVSSYWGDRIDILIGFLFFAASLILKFNSINIFTSQILGQSALKNQVQGFNARSHNEPS